MISDTDAIKICTAITEMTGQDYSDAGARLFGRSLSQEMTLNNALHMLAIWNTKPHSWHRVEAGDLNELWRMQKPASRLTQNQIDTALTAQGLEGDALWIAGRQIRGLVNRGMSFEQAVFHAAQDARGKQLTAAPSKPHTQVGHHFIGNLKNTSINQVLGADNG